MNRIDYLESEIKKNRELLIKLESNTLKIKIILHLKKNKRGGKSG